MNDDLLNKLLRRGIQTGDVPVELDDAAVDHWLNHQTAELPDAIRSSVQSKLKQRLQEAGLRGAGPLNEVVAPVGRLILAVRDGAGLSRADVSERFGKSEEYLKQIEENDADFPNTSAEEFATLMEILQLRLSKVSEAIHRSIDSWGFGSMSGWQGSVATGLKNDDKDHAQTEATAPWQKNRQLSLLSEKKKAAEVWLTNLQSVLRKRNRTDLLR
jgi:ribosome-binding protein aMBF1 (putative translation factor)